MSLSAAEERRRSGSDDESRDSHALPSSAALVEWLKRPQSYKDPTSRVELKETHISWVFLTDRYAYKLKKPVRFDFLDFSTAEARRAACAAEVRLNQRLAPGAYLGVVAVTADAAGRLSLDGNGRPVDWLVKMRRLPSDRMLDELVHSGRLTSDEAVSLATTLAEFYGRLSPLMIPAEDYCRTLESHVRSNRHELLKPFHQLPAAIVKRVHAAQLRFVQLNRSLLEGRVCDGRIVEGHGDLRPEHICLDGEPKAFDCIEFNEDFRRLDVADELEFLSMECDRLGADWVGRQVVEVYRQLCRDPFPCALGGFYKCYRACVRAKVAVLRHAEAVKHGENFPSGSAVEYLCLADRYAAALGPPMLVVVCGLMGVGKSTLAASLADACGCELLETDRVRKEIFGPSPVPAGYGDGIYRPESRQLVYDTMFRRAREALTEGLSVVMDGSFLSADQRQRALDLAGESGAAPLLVRCECPDEVALERLRDRARRGDALSEARAELFRAQQRQQQPDSPDIETLVVDTTLATALQAAAVNERLSRLLCSRREAAPAPAEA